MQEETLPIETMPLGIEPVEIHIPGSIANLGPGFDTLAVAVNLYLSLLVETGVFGLAALAVVDKYALWLYLGDQVHYLVKVAVARKAVDLLRLAAHRHDFDLA